MTSSSPRGLLILTLLTLGMSLASRSGAAGPGDTQAIADYRQGLQLIEQKSYAEALKKLEASYQRLPSPNTMLLMAHAHRELGDKREAARLYEQVSRDAQQRVDAGEARFSQTKKEADTWLQELGRSLGRLQVTVLHVPSGTVVEVDGKPIKVESTNTDTLRSEKLWWPIGEVEVVAHVPGQAGSVAKVEVVSGGVASVTVDVRTVHQDKPKVRQRDPNNLSNERQGGGIPLGTWIGLGAGTVGLGTFAIFGSMSKSKASDLDACAPNCPSSMQDTADAGKTYQTVANVGLVVGGVGLATAVGFYLFGGSDSDATKQEVNVSVGPSNIGVRGSF